jgi:hypothetical protein
VAAWLAEQRWQLVRRCQPGGILIDGPGIAVNSQGPTFFVEGGDHGVWERTLTANFTSDGSNVNHGVGAAALS